MPQAICPAARFLLEMRLTGRIETGLPQDLRPSSLDAAYRVQAQLVDALLARRGGTRIGYKIACSNELAQRLLNVDAPLFGTLLSCSTYRSGTSLRAADFRVRCMEPEFGFEIGEDVPGARAGYCAGSIQPFVAAAFPALEIVDHRFRDWSRVGAATLVADNAIHGAWIAGEPFAQWRSIDFARHPVALAVNGKAVHTGSGAAVLGNPLNAVAWLANELQRRGMQLREGDRISTGVATDVHLAEAGDRVKADFGQLGSVEVAFE